MSKLLIFVLIAVAVYLLLRRPLRRNVDESQRAAPAPEPMVACARCGLHVLRSESVEAAGRHYCCPEHQRLDAGEPGRG